MKGTLFVLACCMWMICSCSSSRESASAAQAQASSPEKAGQPTGQNQSATTDAKQVRYDR